MRSIDPFYWGFKSLAIAEDALLNNQINIVSLNAVFQDGVEISVPGNTVVASRSFETEWTQVDRPFTVYLGLRRFDPNHNNVASYENEDMAGQTTSAAITTRYRASYTPQAAADVYGDGNPEQVRRLTYDLGLYWESEIPEIADCDFLPMLRLIHIGDKAVVDNTFIPPALDMQAFPALKQIMVDIRDQLLGRAARLEEYKPTQGKNEQWAGDPKVYGMLLTLLLLNRNIPPLNFAAETPGVRPWRAYLDLRQLFAELSSLVPGYNALGESDRGEKMLRDYNHADPFPCFQSAHQMVSLLLSSLSAGPEHMLRMEKDENGYLTAKPPDAFFASGFHYFLMVRTSGKPEEVVQEVPRFAKLSSLHLLKNLVAQALPGVPMRPVDDPPLGLPRRPDTVYFEINFNSPLWKEALQQEDKTIAFYWADRAESSVVHLVAIRTR